MNTIEQGTKRTRDQAIEASKQFQLQKTNYESDDGAYNYASSLLSYGLLSRDFQDATKEEDGKCSCRLWKFLMLHFKTNG